ncbi:DUF1684 domain-containing protein [Nocardia sp. NPDC088792]|uniref:DUF1684 domain-containing protein n=1 Tax=Nocardia sp. NPDC088792 TaxID=3364332 RepID=UPI00382FC621
MTATDTATEFDRQWDVFRAERDTWARQPLGWLSITGLHWLGDTDETVDGLPGLWRTDGENVYVTVESGADLRLDGQALPAAAVLTPAEGAPGLEVRTGDRIIEVIRRTGQFALRIHDPAAPTLAAYTGIPVYEADPAWALTGLFEPYESAQVVTTGAVVAGLEHHHSAAGTVTFELGGATQRLIAFGSAETGLHALFTDATGGVTTYGGARRLDLGRPAADGSLTLDFNRAVNLPCAFTDHATCPVAPAENRLTVSVEAGEQDPRKEQSL